MKRKRRRNKNPLILFILFIGVVVSSLSIMALDNVPDDNSASQTNILVQASKEDISVVPLSTGPEAIAAEPVIMESEPEEELPLLTDEEIDLIALCTMAEAEGECEEGKRLVIDTILNRVDSPYFPDTVHDVIYQPYQFSAMWNGRVDRCEVREDICQLVREEMESRINYEVVFFMAGGYSKYGVPLFQVEHHYFSKYE